MKKLSLILITIFASILFTLDVLAASFSARASTTTIAPGGTFSVSVGGDAIGRVDISVSNGQANTTSVWVEQNTQVVTITAGSSGTVTVTATPVVGFSDADANIYNPGPRTVIVKIDSGNSTATKPQTPTQTPTVSKSSNNLLASLDVSEGNITPSFKSSTTEYTVNLSGDVASLNISAKASDAKAKVSGTGNHNLKAGLNTLEVTVTAENGAKKVYTIKVYVDETPKVYLSHHDEQIGLVKNLEGVKLDGFESVEREIDGEKTTVFQNGQLTLIYGLDESLKKNFYLLNMETDTITSMFVPVITGGRTFYVIESDAGGDTFITIDDKEVPAKRTMDEEYFVLRVIDEEGNSREYIYDSREGTIQRRANISFADEVCQKESHTMVKVVIIILSAGLLFFVGLSFYFYKSSKKVK